MIKTINNSKCVIFEEYKEIQFENLLSSIFWIIIKLYIFNSLYLSEGLDIYFVINDGWDNDQESIVDAYMV